MADRHLVSTTALSFFSGRAAGPYLAALFTVRLERPADIFCQLSTGHIGLPTIL